jgi:hypothetical protein
MAIVKDDKRAKGMQPGDHFFHFNASQRKMKYYLSDGMLQWTCEARGDGETAEFTKNGSTPPGLYQLLSPEWIGEKDEDSKSLGRWFIRLAAIDAPVYTENKRTNIGIHGGGTGLASPLSDTQGWVTTLGCIRVQNIDLNRIAWAVQQASKSGKIVWLNIGWDAPERQVDISQYF